MTDPTDLIARADAEMDGVTEGPWVAKGDGVYKPDSRLDDCHAWSVCTTHDCCDTSDGEHLARFIAASRQLVPALRDALAAALTRAELAECHAKAMEAERDRLAAALREITETPARRHQIRIARAALTGEPQP